MRQYTGEVGVETFVDGQYALSTHGFQEAVPGPGVEVAGLVVHARHDGVCS